MTSTQVSLQPSESSLNSFDFFTFFLYLPPPLSLDSVLLVVNASSVLFIISQVFAYVMASGVTLACALNEVDVLPLVDDFTVSGPMMLCT